VCVGLRECKYMVKDGVTERLKNSCWKCYDVRQEVIFECDGEIKLCCRWLVPSLIPILRSCRRQGLSKSVMLEFFVEYFTMFGTFQFGVTALPLTEVLMVTMDDLNEVE
jgi:hypothetical protein